MVSFQHDGTGIIKYSFLGSALPSYVNLIDLNGDDTPDVADVFNLGYGGDFLGVNLDENGEVPNLSFTSAQQAGIVSAINAWNEVANIRMEPGGAENEGDAGTGTAVTGTGQLVGGLGGDAGFGETELSRNDDGFTSIDIGAVFEDGLNFFGGNHSSIFVNTNGSISFESGISTFTPQTITGGSTPIIAPFWADVDTSVDTDADTPDSGPIYVDINAAADIVTITWANVGYYDQKADLTNAFQLQLYDRGSGNFDIVFRYADINWTTGDASSGQDGLGGTPARMGYSAGNASDFFELPASGNQSAILALDTTPGNTGQTGLWEFEVRNGGIFGDIVFGQADLLLEGSYDRDFTAPISPTPYSAGGLSGTSSSDPDVVGIDGDVYFRVPDGDGFSFFPGEQDYWAALRAVGQGLGLEPAFDAGPTVMEPDESDPFYITPARADIELVQSIYGPNWTTRADDTVYFAPGGVYALDPAGRLAENGTRGLATVWDGGGNDLLDLSHNTLGIWGGFGPDSTLFATRDGGGATAFASFTEPTYSSPTTEQLGLAPSNHIESIRLGSGNDSVDAGNWDETLEGGLGDDLLRGFDGDDVFYGGYALENRPSDMGMDGNDVLVGLEGTDTAVFDDPNTYTLILSPDRTLMVDRLANGTGTDEIHTIETLMFQDDRFDVFPTDTFDLTRFDGVVRISAEQLQEIIELYIAYFNRAPDVLGLLFWADAFADDGLSIEQVAAGFIDQPETRALYPEGTGNRAFVEKVYTNVLGRPVDDGGRMFWELQLDNNVVGRDTFILEILRGAKADAPPDASQEFIDLQMVDQQYLAAKTEIGSYFSIHKGLSDVPNANAAMQLFTRDTLDQQPAVAAIDAYAAASMSETSGDFLIQVQGILNDPFEI